MADTAFPAAINDMLYSGMARSTKPAAPAAKQTGRYIALMRGINVGGKNLLPMATLAKIFEEAGCTDVRTYIQSGNVVFTATAAVASAVAQDVARKIATKLKIQSP